MFLGNYRIKLNLRNKHFCSIFFLLVKGYAHRYQTKVVQNVLATELTKYDQHLGKTLFSRDDILSFDFAGEI